MNIRVSNYLNRHKDEILDLWYEEFVKQLPGEYAGDKSANLRVGLRKVYGDVYDLIRGQASESEYHPCSLTFLRRDCECSVDDKSKFICEVMHGGGAKSLCHVLMLNWEAQSEFTESDIGRAIILVNKALNRVMHGEVRKCAANKGSACPFHPEHVHN
jgi:hypothetical protein